MYDEYMSLFYRLVSQQGAVRLVGVFQALGFLLVDCWIPHSRAQSRVRILASIFQTLDSGFWMPDSGLNTYQQYK